MSFKQILALALRWAIPVIAKELTTLSKKVLDPSDPFLSASGSSKKSPIIQRSAPPLRTFGRKGTTPLADPSSGSTATTGKATDLPAGDASSSALKPDVGSGLAI